MTFGERFPNWGCHKCHALVDKETFLVTYSAYCSVENHSYKVKGNRKGFDLWINNPRLRIDPAKIHFTHDISEVMTFDAAQFKLLYQTQNLERAKKLVSFS